MFDSREGIPRLLHLLRRGIQLRCVFKPIAQEFGTTREATSAIFSIAAALYFALSGMVRSAAQHGARPSRRGNWSRTLAIVPLSGELIMHLGWRRTYVILSVVAAALPLLCAALSTQPADHDA